MWECNNSYFLDVFWVYADLKSIICYMCKTYLEVKHCCEFLCAGICKILYTIAHNSKKSHWTEWHCFTALIFQRLYFAVYGETCVWRVWMLVTLGPVSSWYVQDSSASACTQMSRFWDPAFVQTCSAVKQWYSRCSGCLWGRGRGAQHRLMGHLQIFFLKNL